LPPAFAALDLLLDAPGGALPAASFRDLVLERTGQLCDCIASCELLGRDEGLRIYRHVLLEARRNDVVIDASESALLGVLRRELGIRPVEHFLIEHHPDFREYWQDEGAFLREMSILRSGGLLFGHEGNVVVAEEALPLIRQALGLEMSVAARRRLYERIGSGDLSEVLSKCGIKASGSREDKIDRTLLHYLQPTEVLRHLSIQTLKDLCRETGNGVSGSKDDLAVRLIDHFLHGRDTPAPEPVKVEEPPEPKRLSELAFRELFTAIRSEELTDILVSIDSPRVTGGKDIKITLLWQATRAEATLLGTLTNHSLEELLERLGLRTSGSKSERVMRLLEHFGNSESPSLSAGPPAD
jgi:hypothetical protein